MTRLIFAALIFIFGFTVDVGAADKPIGWVVKPKPSKPAKPNCHDLETYLNTPSCGRGRRE